MSNIQYPSCGSQRTWRDGLRYVKGDPVQRYLCRSCGKRFSQPNVKLNVAGQIFEISKPSANLSENVVSHSNSALKEDQELIEAGFEYVTERDGAKIYWKRK